jgi:hypothetical protein
VLAAIAGGPPDGETNAKRRRAGAEEVSVEGSADGRAGANETSSGSGQAAAAAPPPIELKTGYRQGLITSITVVLTASVLFFRFAVFEEGSGEWSTPGAFAAALAALSIGIQLWTLRRALQPEDAEIAEYRSTLNYFQWAVGFLVASLICQSVAYAICSSDWAQPYCFPLPVQPGPPMPVP